MGTKTLSLEQLMRKLLPFALCIAILPFVAGCSAQQKAQDVSNILNGILQIVKADIPALPPQDQAVVANWDNLGLSLDGQLNSCIAASGTKSAKLATCFTVFASGLASPAELTQLKVSAGTQSKIILWATAAIIAVNTAEDYFGAQEVAVPPASGLTQNDLDQFRQEVMAYVASGNPGSDPSISAPRT
jgi:hypothetical protein